MNNPEAHPKHYNHLPGGIECIQVVQHFNFNVGNIIKYAWRVPAKSKEDAIRDLHKIQQYAQFEIERLGGVE
jgi:hypothetical protein